MKFKFKRSERVGELIREEIAKMIAREIKDPRIGFVTLTDVDLSNDLKNINVYVSVLGEDSEKKKAVEGLKSSRGYIRRQLGSRLYLKRIPEITFKLDQSIEHSEKMTKLFDKIKKDEDCRQDHD